MTAQEMNHVMVVGCAGNGKTERLSKEISNVLSSGKSVLCLSFTRNAAEELTERVITLDPGCTECISNGSLLITTMHSWLTRLLIELAEAPAISLQTVIDEGLSFLLAHPDIVSAHYKVDVVIVDEAQDLSSEQFTVIMALVGVWRHIKYIIVGDNIQSVFGFQGARPDIMLQLPAKIESKTGRKCSVMLCNVNKRCSLPIIVAANANILNSDIENKENHLMKPPLDRDAQSRTTMPTLLISDDRSSAIQDIKSFVTNLIATTHTSGDTPSIVILHRTQCGLRDIARELLKTMDVDIAFNLDSCAIRGQKSSARVQLRTIHGCKGGTWDIVIIAGVTDTYGLPNERAISEGDVQEEQRLFHVALTRARHQCVLSANVRDKVSRFISIKDAQSCYCVQRGLNGIVSDMDSLTKCFITESSSPQVTSTEITTSLFDMKLALCPEKIEREWSMPVNVSNVSNRLRDCIRNTDDEGNPELKKCVKQVILKLRSLIHRSDLPVQGLESQHFHSASDVCALQRQSLLLIGSVFISEIRGTATHLPSGWLQEVMLPCACGCLTKNSIHAQHQRTANMMFTSLANLGSKRPRYHDNLDRYQDIMTKHGMRATHYRLFSRDWDSSRSSPFTEIKRNVLRAWGFLLETASFEKDDDEARYLQASLWACLRFNPIAAARVTAPSQSDGRVRIDSLANSMKSNLGAVKRIVKASEETVSNTMHEKGTQVIHSLTENLPDTIDFLASLSTIVANTPRDEEIKEFRLVLTHLIDSTPSMAMCRVTVDMQHDVREMIDAIQGHRD